jgi:ATP-dependent protease Clp ATPase subunit
MNQQQLQSQIALNRNLINALHMTLVAYQSWRYNAREDNDEEYAEKLTKHIKKLSRQIEQYVVLQKALKKQLAESIANHRCSFFVEQKSLETVLKSMRNVLKEAV